MGGSKSHPRFEIDHQNMTSHFVYNNHKFFLLLFVAFSSSFCGYHSFFRSSTMFAAILKIKLLQTFSWSLFPASDLGSVFKSIYGSSYSFCSNFIIPFVFFYFQLRFFMEDQICITCDKISCISPVANKFFHRSLIMWLKILQKVCEKLFINFESFRTWSKTTVFYFLLCLFSKCSSTKEPIPLSSAVSSDPSEEFTTYSYPL